MVKDHSDNGRKPAAATTWATLSDSFRLAARVLLYAPPHRQDSTCHAFVTPVTLAGTGNRSWLDPTTHRTVSGRSYHADRPRSPPPPPHTHK